MNTSRGLALGLAGSWWAVRFIAPLLFQLDARDPMTFAGTAAVLVAVGVLAAWIPARRAARLDPATVLREGSMLLALLKLEEQIATEELERRRETNVTIASAVRRSQGGAERPDAEPSR